MRRSFCDRSGVRLVLVSGLSVGCGDSFSENKTAVAESAAVTAFSLKVNFQPAAVAVPAGYVADTGAVYADRGNGFVYGWNADAASFTRDRDAGNAPDQRYDTLIHTQMFGERTWEVAVPNGSYSVRVVAGDASWPDSTDRLNVEGVLTVSGTPTNDNRWVEGTRTVSVTDGKLTLANATGASNNKVAFLEISSSSVGSGGAGAGGSGGSAGSGNAGGRGGTSGTSGRGGTSGTGGTAGSGNAGGSGGRAAGGAASTGGSAGGSSFAAKVNFQPATAAVPSGYLLDSGAVYANRGNGFTYGWDADASSFTRDRNATNSPDQRYDTFVHTQMFGERAWEIAVPNGSYSVHVVAGDAAYPDNSDQINVEGVLTVSGTPTNANRWVEGTRTVQVTDGKLTIRNAPNASNNKLDFVEISAASGGSGGTGGSSGTGGTGASGGAGGSGAMSGGGGSSSGGAAGASPTRSAGCGKPAPQVGDFHVQTTDGAGNARDYEVLVPASYSPTTALALTFVYHGSGGTQADSKAMGLQNASGAAAASIFVFPQGIKFQSYGIGWDDRCSGYDMVLSDRMATYLSDNYCVDPTRIFAAGFSWGCDQVTALSCCRGPRFRAIAPAACTDEFGNNADYRTYANSPCPTSGTTAVRFTYDSNGDVGYTQQQFQSTVALFRSFNSCGTTSVPSGAACISYDGCTKPFLDCRYPGMGHTWPPDWTSGTWSFFSSFH